MNDRQIVLSISMLVSGRDDMYKSLQSLQMFRDAFPCEVILVDTGCSREQRMEIQKYADKIIDFEWCNDFAAARNAGLRETHGEWFMYLDDDERFENPQEIISFFKTGEYRNYYCASYVVRNYRDYSGTEYEASYPLRMAKREPELRFEGKIHEYLYPTKTPKKVFSDYVHHYGYVFRSEEERERHALRNIAPLLETCKKYPGDPRWTGQLAQEYFGLKKYEEVLQVCIGGLENWRIHKESIKYMPAHVALHYAYILTCLENLDRYKEEAEWLVKALEDEITGLPAIQPTVAFYCVRGIALYYKLHNDVLCSKFLRKYLSYARQLKEDRAALESGTAAITSMVFDKTTYYGSILTGLGAAIRMEDEALAEEAFYAMDWMEEGLRGQQEWEREILDAMCTASYRPLWKRMLQTLLARRGGQQEVCAVFAEKEAEYRAQQQEEKLWKLYRLAAELEGSHPYLWEKKILWLTRETNNGQSILPLLEQIVTNCPGVILHLSSEVWEIAEKQNIAMETLLLGIDYNQWRRAVEEWKWNASVAEIRQWENRIASWKGQDDIRYDIFEIRCKEAYLHQNNRVPVNAEDLYFKLMQYTEKILEFYRPLLKAEVLERYEEALPEDALLAVRLQRLLQCVTVGDDKVILGVARRCLGIYPFLDKTVGIYAEYLKEEIQKKNVFSEAEQEEMRQLIQKLKKIAAEKINKGELQEAREILQQIQSCISDDAEVVKMLEQME